MSKQLLLGDEAIAQAALDAGLSGVYAYPGTPSTEITEYIQMAPVTAEKNIHNRWCSNEKTAMEAALGMSFAGKRSLVMAYTYYIFLIVLSLWRLVQADGMALLHNRLPPKANQ